MFSFVFLKAQTNQTSVFSMFGTGISGVENTTQNSLMGGIGVANTTQEYLNFSNPALLSYVNKTIYTMAGRYTYLKTYNENHAQKAQDFSLSYFSLGFPLGKKGGFMVGLKSHTKVAYAYLKGDKDSEQGATETKGKGGEQLAFLAAGFRIFKNFSLGAEAGYIFGNLNHTIVYKKNTLQYDSWFENTTNIKGLQMKLGLHYFHKFFGNTFLNYGAAFIYNKSLKLNEKNTIYKGIFDHSESFRIRQIFDENEKNRSLKKPLKTTLGIAIQKPLFWHTAFNFSFQKAFSFSEKSRIDPPNFRFVDAYKISLGGSYIPNFKSISSYYKRITYRGGFFYQKMGFLFSEKPVYNQGFTLGLGLPIGLRQISVLNFGVRYNLIKNTILRENHFIFKFGLTLRDFWFFKRKIN